MKWMVLGFLLVSNVAGVGSPTEAVAFFNREFIEMCIPTGNSTAVCVKVDPKSFRPCLFVPAHQGYLRCAVYVNRKL